MLYYDFCGYERFKACFGLEKRDNGVAVRKNKILLAHRKILHCSDIAGNMMIMPCYIYMIWLTYRKKVMDAVTESGKR